MLIFITTLQLALKKASLNSWMPMQQFTLYQLNKLIQETLEQNLDQSYWVVAEIGEIRVNQKGHCYLELVEKEGQNLRAKVRANIWAYDFYNLNSLFRKVTGHPLRTGMKILARAVIQFHELYGLSLQINDLDPNFTLGERARHRQEVIDRLTREGAIQLNKKLPLPLVPQRIAVISSRSAAGYGDFMDHLVGNPQKYIFQVQLFETIMQGEEAVGSVSGAIRRAGEASAAFDLVVLIRGGGSPVDLDCFDSYLLASEIANCPLPVVTGIGHQRDDTITDMVAHSKLKTPTAVADFLISGMMAFEQQLDYQSQQIKSQVSKLLQQQGTQLYSLLRNLEHSARTVINQRYHATDLLNQKLKSAVKACIRDSRNTLINYQNTFIKHPSQIISREQRNLQLLEAKIELADPLKILKRGYSITYLNGKVVKRNIAVEEGDELDTRLHTRTIRSKVINVNHDRAEDQV